MPAFDRVRELPYGENPHQRAAYYAERGARTHLLGFVVQHQGKDLSFNNLGDLSAARLLAGELDRPGVRDREAREPVRRRRRRHDRGGVREGARGGSRVGVRRRRRGQPRGYARRWPTRSRRSSSRSCSRPAYDAAGARSSRGEAGAARPRAHGSARAGRGRARLSPRPSAASSCRIGIARRSVARAPEVVCGEVSGAQWDDLLFAWRVVKHVTSNAIVLAHRGQTLGIGAGQMSRVDAVRIAIQKARELGHSLDGAVLASDAFFPFADGPKLALDAGIAAFIQPGRLEARRRGDRGAGRSGRVDGLHRPAPLPALMDAFDLDVRRHVYFSVVANGRPPTTSETAAAFDAANGDRGRVPAAPRLPMRSCCSPIRRTLDGEPVLLRPDSAPRASRRSRRGPERAAGTRSGSRARSTRTGTSKPKCAAAVTSRARRPRR